MSSPLAELLPRLDGVRPAGPGRYTARCPAHDDRTPSLSVREGANGRPLFHCFAGCSWIAVRDALGGLPARAAVAPPVRIAALSPLERSEIARRLWRECTPATGTAAHAYLEHRGIQVERVPPSLRFHPSLRHPTGRRAPAMVAAVQGRDGQIVAVHRTWIAPRGAGKAQLEPSRAMLGPCADGAVRFAGPAEHLALAEGIETALSVAQACPGLAVWAALSTTGLRRIELPDVVRRVTIC
ncbi:MAG: toprim domain-containing protein, partial [Deltaproteobacteria bacterium]|nr:toprim domain-containing protein [Deltaproteobacteria bacterium]